MNWFYTNKYDVQALRERWFCLKYRFTVSKDWKLNSNYGALLYNNELFKLTDSFEWHSWCSLIKSFIYLFIVKLSKLSDIIYEQVRVHILRNSYIHTYIRTYIHKYVHTFMLCVNACTYIIIIYMYVCMYVCNVCLYVYVFLP